MFTPKELYYYYSTSPCEPGGVDFIGRGERDTGKGTPYDLPRLTNFLKQLKYPCYNKAPYTQKEPSESEPSGILNTGSRKLGIPFKFLQRIDVEAFSEIQPDIYSGTAYAIRNACDVMRACNIEASGTSLEHRLKWEHRSATEHIRYFGGNRITDCLMVLGPDLVPESDSLYRATGCGDLSCLPRYNPKKEGSGLGANFTCVKDPEEGVTICTPCQGCDEDPEDQSKLPGDCCSAGTCEEKMNWCCGDITGARYGVYEFAPLTEFIENVQSKDFPLKHIGILKRKSYGGYANLLNNSGSKFYSCPGDILLKYFQNINNYDYTNDQYKESKAFNYLGDPIETIDRVRTISIIQTNIMQSIKDLLYNGYGVVMMTNVGFPNRRDSTGLSYPDRIWYHSYAIIGYDDRKVDYDECVYLLANSWGKWNDGGHPSWGPIPEGSFLVTETHLQCMLNLYRTDQIGCITTKSVTGIVTQPGCVDESPCVPFGCTTRQKAMGMVFALSMSEGFPRQILDHAQFFKVRESNNEYKLKLYFDGET